ncbi:acyl-protein thioesterase [Bulinus truncatus]|nr:acyl-protein thioesterase [Bulinus truncatus]
MLKIMEESNMWFSLIGLMYIQTEAISVWSDGTMASTPDVRLLYMPGKPDNMFDIRGLDPSSAEDEQGIKESSKELQQLIAKEVSEGIPPERIIIGGFSQGGAVALYTAFGTDTKIGGVLALSTWLPMNKYFTNASNAKYNTGVPVLQCHGTGDPLVSYRWGQATHEIIKTFNPAAQFKSYSNMGHSSNPLEMEDVKHFLQDILKDS